MNHVSCLVESSRESPESLHHESDVKSKTKEFILSHGMSCIQVTVKSKTASEAAKYVLGVY